MRLTLVCLALITSPAYATLDFNFLTLKSLVYIDRGFALFWAKAEAGVDLCTD
jgi:hypothetical protein